jgi:hypothetical protein
MSDIKVVSINSVEQQQARTKADLLEVLDEMREQIESGDIVEFVAVSMCEDGEPQIHAKVIDLPTAVGLFEIGKHMIIQQEAY